MIIIKTDDKFFGAGYDIIFKNTFSTEESLKRLLEDTLGLTITKILSNNIELSVGNIRERRKYLDLILETDQGIINVEINHEFKNELPNRNLLFFFKLISSSIKRNESYEKVSRHIQINITWNLKKYFDFDIENRKFVKCYIMDEETHNKVNSDIFEIVHINMDYFKDVWYHRDDIKENPILMLLAAESIEQIDKISEVDSFVKELGNKIKELNKDPKILDVIIENEDEIIANSFYDKGLAQGISQGIIEGAEKKEKEIAKNMLNNGVDVETVLACTGLSKSEIDNLK